MNARILVVDDEEDICAILKFNLSKEGYEVVTANSAEEALTLDIASFNLLLLDVMMGGMSGFELTGKLKTDPKTAGVPVIFITARDTEDDAVEGLDLGADDYISKPFSIREVVSRVKAVLRRTAAIPDASTGIFIDDEKKVVTVDGAAVALTRIEYEIFKLLFTNKGKVFPREDILSKVWPDDVIVTDRTVDVNITRLRKKIGEYGNRIVSRHGFGYLYEEQ
jgi:two-component system alkaline phosphatase synthesis response regulator PhoP|uniref:response regulator transcription factor n=1 Tax=Candidatus Cryptobacteroides bacterium TaxID=3085639 RepID=UPI004026E9D8